MEQTTIPDAVRKEISPETVTAWAGVDADGCYYLLEACHDCMHDCPREWDNLGVIASWDCDFRGDVSPSVSPTEYLEALPSGSMILPVYHYDHTIQSVSTVPFIGRAQHAEWDSALVGYIHLSPETMGMEWPDLTPEERREKAIVALKEEIKTYDMFLKGKVYQVTLHRLKKCEHCEEWKVTLEESFGNIYADDAAELLETAETIFDNVSGMVEVTK